MDEVCKWLLQENEGCVADWSAMPLLSYNLQLHRHICDMIKRNGKPPIENHC